MISHSLGYLSFLEILPIIIAFETFVDEQRPLAPSMPFTPYQVDLFRVMWGDMGLELHVFIDADRTSLVTSKQRSNKINVDINMSSKTMIIVYS